MKAPDRLVFWQNMLAIHQSAHIRALAERCSAEVVLAVDEEIDAERRALGWTSPDFGPAKVVVAPDDQTIARLLETDPGNSVHIFSGIRAFPTASRAFIRSLDVSTTRGVFAEPGDGRGLRGVVRRIISAQYCRRYGEHISFILATGELGLQWYRRAGFAAAKLYPYGYWMEPFEADWGEGDDNEGGDFRIIFVGRFISLKAIDDLMRALIGLKERDWRLTLIGSGPCAAQIGKLARAGGITDRVRIEAPMGNRQVMAQIARHDLLVLPSRYDGWGAVVNEALMCGVPVVCTDQCGAADLLQEPWRGEVVRARCVPALREALARRIQAGRPTLRQRSGLTAWTDAISGPVAAGYLLEVIRCATVGGPRPEPPWRRTAEETATV